MMERAEAVPATIEDETGAFTTSASSTDFRLGSGAQASTPVTTPLISAERRTSWLQRWRKRSQADNLIPYRHLATQLHHELPRGEHHRTALIASPAGREPDPTPALALAISLADELQQKVLLLDACIRHPMVTKAVGANVSTAGFSDLLNVDGLSISDLFLSSSHPLVSVLPAGGLEGLISVRPDRLDSIIASAVRKFDFVVIAAGSVLHDPVCLALSQLVGCVLLTVTENVTRKSDLTAAKNLLEACRARKVAVILSARGRRDLQVV